MAYGCIVNMATKNMSDDVIQLDQLLELDKVIHERVRLGIMSALSASKKLTFNDIKQVLKATDGNLGMHLRMLEKHEYIEVEKKFVGRKPQTSYQISEKGQKAFRHYICIIEKLVSELK
ncbi:transcriptional regulator [Candidatus Uabimicrobium amorphum]|uniref:Transcriptional regulator n=2 Tax=Uabimicrobium amorphum TaxID=2596890 RepID=A0A5S9F7U6_UABAM|nr:transcriptional regulator [Candidatus Uabimicrobium amorphum]